jgi:hypothetical protein
LFATTYTISGTRTSQLSLTLLRLVFNYRKTKKKYLEKKQQNKLKMLIIAKEKGKERLLQTP